MEVFSVMNHVNQVKDDFINNGPFVRLMAGDLAVPNSGGTISVDITHTQSVGTSAKRNEPNVRKNQSSVTLPVPLTMAELGARALSMPSAAAASPAAAAARRYVE
jgi:hypothetical protein